MALIIKNRTYRKLAMIASNGSWRGDTPSPVLVLSGGTP